MSRRMEEKTPFWTKKRLLKAALGLCICVMAAALVYIGWFTVRYITTAQTNDAISGIYAGIPSPPSAPSPSMGEAAPPAASPEDPAVPVAAPPSERVLALEAEKLGMERFASLLEINADFLGMLKIPGLNMELAYVASEDHEHYLHYDFYGKRNDAGTVFLSAYNDRLLLDRNNVLFGHNMTDNTMFAPLSAYRNASGYTKAPVIYLDSLTGESAWIVFASYPCEPNWGYVSTKLNKDSFSELLDEIKARSLFLTDVDVNEDDRILTLSTCSYEAEDMRFAVHARKLREGEELPEVVTAEKNPDPLPYTAPKQIKIDEIEASGTAVLHRPSASNKLYFYQTRSGAVDWYAGFSATNLQGPYTNFKGKVTTENYLAAGYETHTKRTYWAIDRYNNKKGIYLFFNDTMPRGMLHPASDAPVTPSGEDARYPFLACVNKEMWLLYTLAGDDGETIYRLRIESKKASGAPEPLLTLPTGSNARVAGYFAVDGHTALIWHEKANKTVRGVWTDGGGDIFAPQLSGEHDRLTVYGEVSSDKKIRVLAEKGGKLTPSTFDLKTLPAWIEPAVPAVSVDPDSPLNPDDPSADPNDPDSPAAPDNVSAPAVSPNPNGPDNPSTDPNDPDNPVVPDSPPESGG